MNKKIKAKKQVALVLSIVAMAILISAAGLAVAGDDSVGNYLGFRASEVAKEELPFVQGDPNILAMTDAGYAIVGGEVGGKTTEECIDGVIASSGCTIGKANLLLIHRSKEKPLWFAFFNKSSGECVYLEVDNSVFDMTAAEVKALPDDKVFTKIAKANIGADKLLNEPEAWQPQMDAKKFGGNEFSIITIPNVWAKGAPYELLKTVEFHNHICPGVTSGYNIIEYLDENLPLQGNQNYEIIGCPPWCKDDAFQVIYDKTVGKRFVAMHLTPEDSVQLPGAAGIYIRWDKATDTGHGLVVAFNWTKAKELCGVDDPANKKQPWYWWWMRLKMDVEMMDLEDPKQLVSTMKEFDLNSKAELMELKYAGNNPYVVLGLLPDPALANLVGPENINVDNLLGWRASEFAMKNMSFEKYDPNILAMTDAGYAVVDGKTTENCIDGIQAKTGCTVGKGDLLLIHRSRQRPLWFAFFDKKTGNCLYLEVDNSVFDKSIDEFMALPDEEVFKRTVKENVSPDRLLNESYAPVWDAKVKAKIFGGGSGPFTNEFTFITIPNVWAKGNGTPRELLAASQFHNHICPGLTSGYFLFEYLEEHLPLEKPSQRYQVIAIPPWCKDDALQWNLEATIGNKNYVAKDLTTEQKDKLPANAKNVAGLFIRWDSATGTGDGLVLAFNWTKACEISEFPRSDFKDFATYKWWWARLKMNQDMMDYIDEPETVIETIMKFEVNSPSELSHLKSAGVNPLVELGVMPE
ncbi:MAG: FmdE family protein [Euryarchaeota archaeon]|nr:FmdE family protein [Euryarchaeota archaeon]